MAILRRLPILALLLILVACHRGRGSAGPAPAAPVPWIPIASEDRIYYDNSGGIQDSVRLVIRDAETYQDVWSRATSQQASPPPAPPVDFTTRMLLLVGAGRMTPEDQIHVDSVVVRPEMNSAGQRQDMMTAIVRVTEGCRRFNADAYPIEIVRVRRFNGPVRFEERRVQAQGCQDGPDRP